jgi:hypothetical protein
MADVLSFLGNSPIAHDGELYTPRCKVGQELSEEEGYAAAKSAGLAAISCGTTTAVDLRDVDGVPALAGDGLAPSKLNL